MRTSPGSGDCRDPCGDDSANTPPCTPPPPLHAIADPRTLRAQAAAYLQHLALASKSEHAISDPMDDPP
jgi:hypothetical protein